MATYQNAHTSYIAYPENPTTKYAYRVIGPLSTISVNDTHGTTTTVDADKPPLLFLPHFRGVMDLIDPLLINSLAATRPVLLTDYVGSGKSIGETAPTAAAAATQILDFLTLVAEKNFAGKKAFDILGFSVGGRIAQLVTLNAKSHSSGVQIRRLIIAGSTASKGPGIIDPSPERAELIPKLAAAPTLPLSAYKTLFFEDSKIGREAAEKWWARLSFRTEATSGEPQSSWLNESYTSWDNATGIHAQATWLSGFDSVEGSRDEEGSYERLPSLDVPVLVANGNDDFMVPTVNSFVTQQRVRHGKLIVYPNSGHGFLYQYAEQFASDVEKFLG